MIIDKTDFLCGINLNTDDSPKMYSTTSSVVVIVMTSRWPFFSYTMETQSNEKGRNENNVGVVPKRLPQGPETEKIDDFVAQSPQYGPKCVILVGLVAQSLMYGPKNEKADDIVAQSPQYDPESEKMVILVAQSLLYGPKTEKIDVLVAQSLLYWSESE